jgi:hypothetical protein
MSVINGNLSVTTTSGYQTFVISTDRKTITLKQHTAFNGEYSLFQLGLSTTDPDKSIFFQSGEDGTRFRVYNTSNTLLIDYTTTGVPVKIPVPTNKTVNGVSWKVQLTYVNATPINPQTLKIQYGEAQVLAGLAANFASNLGTLLPGESITAGVNSWTIVMKRSLVYGPVTLFTYTALLNHDFVVTTDNPYFIEGQSSTAVVSGAIAGPMINIIQASEAYTPTVTITVILSNYSETYYPINVTSI